MSRPISLWCLVYGDSDVQPFEVETDENTTCDALKTLIKTRRSPEFDAFASDRLKLWKWNIAADINTEDLHRNNVLDSRLKIADVFKDDPPQPAFTHIITKVPTLISPSNSNESDLAGLAADPSSKHLGIPIVEIDETPKRLLDKRAHSPSPDRAMKRVRIHDPHQRKWVVNGAIRLSDIAGSYYLNFLKQEVTSQCLNAVYLAKFVLLSGPRASGKTTRLNMIKDELLKQNYDVFYFTFQYLTAQDTLESFWETFNLGDQKISSARDFLRHFKCQSRGTEQNVVLLVDEFSSLHNVQPHVRDSFLNIFRTIRNADSEYVIRSIIAAGIYSMTSLRTSNNSVSPLDSGIHIENSNFTRSEVEELFHQFAKDRKIEIGENIIEDIFDKTKGHPGLVCLCGRTIEENLKTFVVNHILLIEAWHAYPADQLYESIARYNAFDFMLNSLKKSRADPAITLLRRFLGYLDEIEVNDNDRESADRLTSEGVLIKLHPNQLLYRMSSPLVDGLLRTKLLRELYPLEPPGPPPRQANHSLDVVVLLEKALALFDRQHMANACETSSKLSGIFAVDNQKGCLVPRESVYDTELMRILSNWLTPYAWSVVGQWHLRTKSNNHRYSDITLSNKSVDGKHIVLLELLATATQGDIDSHIKRIPEDMKLLSATEAWIIHFTCQDNFVPVEPSPDVLSTGVNVLHFVHDLAWTKVVVHGYWKDHTGHTWSVANKVIINDVVNVG